MPQDDDEIIQSLEERLTFEEPVLRSNRGFWLVVGALALACLVVLVEIFANRPIANAISTAEHDLRVAQAGAQHAFDGSGSFAGADTPGLTAGRFDNGELTYVGADTASRALGQVSVSASDAVWAGAVQVRPGACFYLRLEQGTAPRYGVGTECTATRALASRDDHW